VAGLWPGASGRCRCCRKAAVGPQALQKGLIAWQAAAGMGLVLHSHSGAIYPGWDAWLQRAYAICSFQQIAAEPPTFGNGKTRLSPSPASLLTLHSGWTEQQRHPWS
jgi:hypothetical protein